LKKNEIPDQIYREKVKETFYVGNENEQSDCCIFFKMKDSVTVNGEMNLALNNVYICSKDQFRCM